MTTRRDAIARNLCARICDERRSIDELRVVDSVLSGLERGSDIYGPLDLATDPRDWQMEIAEERRDELVYRSCALLSKRDERVTAPDAASVEERPGQGSLLSRGVRTEEGRPASDARRLAPISAPADTVVPHDGERTHGGNLSAAGRHGARRDDATPLDPGHETPTGGDSSDCECSDEPWLRHRVDDRAESHMPWCPARINATPEVPDLNSAEMWRAEVDGKFDDGGES